MGCQVRAPGEPRPGCRVDQHDSVASLHKRHGAIEEELILIRQVVVEVRGVCVGTDREPATAGSGDCHRSSDCNVFGDQLTGYGAVRPGLIDDRDYVFCAHGASYAGSCPGGGGWAYDFSAPYDGNVPLLRVIKWDSSTQERRNGWWKKD